MAKKSFLTKLMEAFGLATSDSREVNRHLNRMSPKYRKQSIAAGKAAGEKRVEYRDIREKD